jgi:drug/metabolite transporter (DMT)-like permease
MTASTATGRPITASLVAVVLWASYLVGTRLVFTGTSVGPFAYVVSQMIAGGLFMVVLAGRGRMPWLDLMNWWTAAYGALRAVVIGATSLALVHLPVTQASLLGSMNVPMAAVAEWLMRGRRPPPLELLGNGLLLLAVALIVVTLPGGDAYLGLAWQVISESSAVTSGVVVWRHPANQGDSIPLRARTTGVLLVAAATVLALAWWLLAQAGVAPQPFTPGTGGLADPELWLYGGAAGVLVRGPGTYLSLYVYRYGGIHTHMAGLATIPLAAIAFEQIVVALGWLPPSRFSSFEAAAMALVLAGSMLLLWVKARPAAA